MKTSLRERLKSMTPPLVMEWLRRCFRRGHFHGDYSSWRDARRVSGSEGYASSAIAERILASTLKVRAGEVAFERDGVTFDTPAPDYPLLACLLEIASRNCGKLRVLDLGGSLGTVYWRHRGWFDRLPELRWDIVEQAGFVAMGKKYLADTPLRFFPTIEEAAEMGTHEVLLASGVLQYLENPVEELIRWRMQGWTWIILNNLPLHEEKPDRLTVQRVPEEIYSAVYPAWFFNRQKMRDTVLEHYEIVDEFASEAVWRVNGSDYPSTGWLLQKKGLS